jgi:hypothetical protein
VHLITSGSSNSFALASADNNISAMHTAAIFFILISHFHKLPRHDLDILQFDTHFVLFVLSKALALFLNSGGIHIFQRIS